MPIVKVSLLAIQLALTFDVFGCNSAVFGYSRH